MIRLYLYSADFKEMFIIVQKLNKNAKFLSRYVPNPKERTLILISFVMAVVIISMGILLISKSYNKLMVENIHNYKGMYKQIGSISRIGFFAALSLYPVLKLLKWQPVKKMGKGKFQLKTFLQFVGKLLRKWHAPIAILSTAFVLLHGYMAILRGFTWNFTYVTGMITIVLLLFLLFMGLKRFKRTDKNWHFKLAIGFLLIFMIHATFT
jgi:hypothetical protein